MANPSENPAYIAVLQALELRNDDMFVEPRYIENPAFVSARDRCFTILQTLKNLIETTPTDFTMMSIMPTILAYVDNCIRSLQAFIHEGSSNHVLSASIALEQNVGPLLWGFLPIGGGPDSGAYGEILRNHSDFATRSLDKIAAQRDALYNAVNNVESYASSLTQRLDEMSNSAAKERAESAAAVARLEQAFTQNETIRESRFEALTTSYETRAKEGLDSQTGGAASVLQKLNDYRDQASAIVQVVGNIGVTGNYQLIANREAKQANFWRWATIVIFAVGIAVALTTFYKYLHDPVTTDNALAVLIRLFYAIIITTPALYTARESARHRSNSDRARQTELELASIGPFIELLPEDKKTEIRSVLTAQYFGRSSEAHVVSSPLDPSALTAALKDLGDLIKGMKP